MANSCITIYLSTASCTDKWTCFTGCSELCQSNDWSSMERRRSWQHSTKNMKCCWVLYWTDVAARRWCRRDALLQHSSGNTARTSMIHRRHSYTSWVPRLCPGIEIDDSHLPGYVYFPLRYLLAYCTDDDKYNHSEDNGGKCLSNSWLSVESEGMTRHGPAILRDYSHSSYLCVDSVPCVCCLSWPPQAADWPTRHRNHDWPDSATVDHVVNNGCDVVGGCTVIWATRRLGDKYFSKCPFGRHEIGRLGDNDDWRDVWATKVNR